MDWQAVGQGIGGVVVGFGGALALWMRREGIKARNNAEAAAANAERAKSDAEGALYTLIVQRLKTVEGEVTRLNLEVEKERGLRQQLEAHIFHLENVMRTKGIDVPARAFVMG